MTDKEHMLLKLKYGEVNFNLLVLMNVLLKNNIDFSVDNAIVIHINRMRIYNSSLYEGLMFVRGLGFLGEYCKLCTLRDNIVDIINGKVKLEDITEKLNVRGTYEN